MEGNPDSRSNWKKKKKHQKTKNAKCARENSLPEGERERARHPYGINKDIRGHRAVDVQHNGELEQHKGEYIKQSPVSGKSFLHWETKNRTVGARKLGQEVAWKETRVMEEKDKAILKSVFFFFFSNFYFVLRYSLLTNNIVIVSGEQCETKQWNW